MEEIKICKKIQELFDRKAPEKPLVILGLFLGALQPDLSGDILDNPDTANAEIWTMNDWHNAFPQLLYDKRYNFTRCYQLHLDYYDIIKSDMFSENYKEWIDYCNRRDVEIVSFVPIEGANRNTIFPVEKVLDKIPKDFMRSSVSWMIGHAIIEGYSDIFLRRIKVSASDEIYTAQQQTLLYACRHFAEKYGIKIDSPWRVLWEQQTPKIEWDKLKAISTLYGLYGYRPFMKELEVVIDERRGF